MNSIAHIINPVKVPITSDLYYAQPITFESMRVAKEFAKDRVNVSLYTTQYPEDHDVIPNYFKRLIDLERSVADVADFKQKRKLPLIKDIIQRLYEASEAEYLIYTNVDIAVLPNFYTAVNAYIQQGYDAFIINRRRIDSKFTEVADLPLMYAEVGLPHPGFDCFVFHRSIVPYMVLEHICIGIPYIEISLAHNLFCFAKRFKLYQNQHLTFHVGKEVIKKWGSSQYVNHNAANFKKIKKQLMPKLDIRKFPYANLVWYKRYSSWIFNPAMQIGICLQLEWRGFKKKLQYRFHNFFLKFIDNWR